MKSKPETWHRAAVIHDSFWDIPLTKIERLCYLYLSSFCQKPFRISLVVMAQRLEVKIQRVKRAIDTLRTRHMLTRRDGEKGHAHAYQITLCSSKRWGQTDLPLGPNGPTPLGPNGPTGWGQTDPLTNHLTSQPEALLLSIFRTQFTSWTFNRKPIGKHFHFTRPMEYKALECMRFLVRRPGLGAQASLEAFLRSCGEYLAHSRDVLSPQKDMRALSPARWLQDWAEQVRLVGIYIDERAEKVVRMEASEP